MEKKTKITQCGSSYVKAPNQIKAASKPKIEKGGDLRAGKSGGEKAKGSL